MHLEKTQRRTPRINPLHARKHKRFLVNAGATICLTDSEWIKSVVTDISYRGLCLQGPDILNSNKKYAIQIETHDTYSIASVQAKFKSCSPGEGQPLLHFEILTWTHSSPYLDSIFSEKWLSHLKQHSHATRLYHNGKFSRQANLRGFQRLNSAHPTLIFDLENNSSSEGEVINISEGGLRLRSAQPFLVGSRLNLKINLDTSEVNTISAYVKWTHFVNTAFHFETGIQFDKAEIKNMDTIRKRLEKIVRYNPMSLAQ